MFVKLKNGSSIAVGRTKTRASSRMSSQKLKPDRNAEALLMSSDSRLQIDVLFGRPNAPICVRTVPERLSTAGTVYKDGHRVRLLHFGSFDELHELLCTYNRCGFAVYLTINPTDGRGVKRENIVAVRNLCLDLDGAPPPKEWEIPPHLIVETSRGKFQCFWNIKPTTDLEAAENMGRRLAKHYDGDPKVFDAPHVFRLAGFCHQKREPFLSRVVHVGFEPPTTLRAFDAFLPKLPKRPKPKHIDEDARIDVERAELLFEHFPVDELRGEDEWRDFAMALHWSCGGDDEVAELFFEFCMTDPAYNTEDFDAKNRTRWASFDATRDNGLKIGTLYRMCVRADVPAAIRAQLFSDRISAAKDFENV